MGLCRSLPFFCLEGEEASGKIGIWSFLLSSNSGRLPVWLAWGLPECSGNSQGAKCSAIYKIWKLSRSDVYLVGRQPKENLVVVSQAEISTRFGGEKILYVSQNLLFSSSACSLPCVRQRWEQTGDFNFDSCHYWDISWAVTVMLRIWFSRLADYSVPWFPLLWHFVEEKELKTREEGHLEMGTCGCLLQRETWM